MSKDKTTLPAAVIGLGTFGTAMIHALGQCPQATIVGACDKDPAAARQAQAETGVNVIDDGRLAVAQWQPRVVFLGTPPAACGELIQHCADRGIAVWKQPPLGRSLQEAAQFVQTMDGAKTRFAVGLQRRFCGGYRRMLAECKKLGRLQLVRGHYAFDWGAPKSWRTDKLASGGGAMLELGFHIIDLIVKVAGLPEEVYGLIGGGKSASAAAKNSSANYDTEDAAIVSMQFGDGCLGEVSVSRRCSVLSEKLVLIGENGTMVADAEKFIHYDAAGRIVDQLEDQPTLVEMYRRQADAFLGAIVENSSLYECSARHAILTQAVIESAYLAARTGQPESPAKLLKAHRLSVANCTKLEPV